MAATSSSLFTEFPPASDSDWRRAAEEALDGAPFEKRLVTRTAEGIDLQPIYASSDGDRLALAEAWPGLPPYRRGADPLGARNLGWLICQEMGCRDLGEFNAALREALGRGQNAVVLRLDAATRAGRAGTTATAEGGDAGLALATAADVDVALRGVDLSAVPVFVHAGISALPVTALLAAWLGRQGQPAALHGAVLAEPLTEWVREGVLPVDLACAYDEMATLTAWVRRDGLRLRTVGVDASAWADAGAHAVQELAFGLATGVEYLRALTERGLTIDEAAPRFLFTYGLGSNFFMEIAKLRAARVLWAQASAKAGGGAEAQRLVCHGRTVQWNKTLLDPHVNLLRTTTEAFAGVLGGCAGLNIGAFDACAGVTHELSRRLARNVQIILAEECHAGRVVDPAGGSWYVESLTEQLAAKAWTLFQELERRGGMAAAIRDGYPQSLVEKTAAERIAAVETRRDGVVGTTLFPNAADQVPALPAVPAAAPRNHQALPGRDLGERDAVPAKLLEMLEAGGSLVDLRAALGNGAAATPAVATVRPRRRTEAFETLRRRADEHRRLTGTAPRVFLAKFGPRKQHAARAEFSAGFFAAGGFVVDSGPASETAATAAAAAIASGAPIVVICSTDETYPALVPPLAQALKAAAKPPVVILAGLPAAAELQSQFKAAGVDEFIHLRANCAQLLAGLQDRLGLPASPSSSP